MPTEPRDLPDPATEIRMTTLHATRGANFWSRSPVTRLDLAVGAYEDISSADAPWAGDLLRRAMPALVEHRCSVGERGGFLRRLRAGTYAPHIVEHVALELQTMIGHEVGFGRTRGGDVAGEYTLVFEHLHEAVGLRAAALALEAVQRAFAGTLADVDGAVAELRALAQAPDAPPLRQDVLCAITGGRGRDETRRLLGAAVTCGDELVVDVSPAFILQAGLPFRRAEVGVILDAAPNDVPPRYREEARAQRLLGTLADGVRRDGIVIVPAKEWELQEMARDADCRVAIFATGDDVTRRDRKYARAAAWVAEGRILVDGADGPEVVGALTDGLPAAAQVAAALAAETLADLGRCARSRRTPDAAVA
ncbi:MAG TPA: hypothetical protein VNA89_00135 [Gemmatimonadaceae bacterium]|nr:hypothetical protein [Gemmatimonadaceae bacterium]